MVFHRHNLIQYPLWTELKSHSLSSVEIIPNGRIEDSDSMNIWVDFANKYIGGGVLGHVRAKQF